MNERLTIAQIRSKTATSLYRTKAEMFPAELVPGKILREDIRAGSDIPDTDAAACDGYACGELELPSILKVMGNSSELLLSDTQLSSGECARIRRGEPVPAGTQRVVPYGQIIRIDEEHVSVKKVYPVRLIVRKGEKKRIGDLLLKNGEKLSAQHAALLGEQQKERVRIALPPKTAVTMISGQSERSQRNLHSGILQFQAHLREYGFPSVHEQTVSDMPEQLMNRLHVLQQQADAVVILMDGRQPLSMLAELMRKENDLVSICSGINVIPEGGIAIAMNSSGGVIAAVDYTRFFLLLVCEEIIIPILHAMQGALQTEPSYIYVPLQCIDISSAGVSSAGEHGFPGFSAGNNTDTPWESVFPVRISEKGIRAEKYPGAAGGTADDDSGCTLLQAAGGYMKIQSENFSWDDDCLDCMVPIRILKQ